MNEVKTFLTGLPIWTHKNAPKEFFVGMAGLIGLGLVVLALPIDIPAALFFFLGPLAVFWGLRMLYQNKWRSDFATLRVLTIVTMAAALVVIALLIKSVGDPIGPTSDGSVSDLYQECAEGSMSSCDTLYRMTSVGSQEEWFGLTCGGRSLEPLYGACADSGY